MLLFVYTSTRKRFVIFTCRYFKLSLNTTALSQSNCRNFSCSSINAITNNLIVATQAFITRVIKGETSLSYSFCSILLLTMAHVFVVRDSLLQKTFNLTVENSYVAFLNHTTSSRTCSLYAGQGIPDLITLSAKDFKESFLLYYKIEEMLLRH